MATWTKQQGDWFARAEQNQDNQAAWYSQAAKNQAAQKAAWYNQAQAHDLALGQGNLNPALNNQYQQAITAANSNYAQGLAQNTFNRGQALQGFNNQRQQLLQRYDQMRQQMPYAANNRGILGSGIWNQQLQDATRNQSQALGNLNYTQGGTLGQFDILRQNLAAQRANTVGGLQAARAGAQQGQTSVIPGFG